MLLKQLRVLLFGLMAAVMFGVGGLHAATDDPPAKKAPPEADKKAAPENAKKAPPTQPEPPTGPRVELALMELAVLKEEMAAQKGKKIEGDILAKLTARLEAAEKLLKPPYGIDPPAAPKKK
jgi:hypothetical protein